MPSFAFAFACACGTGPFEDEPGGRDNLPTRAAGPYKKLELDFDTPADEPYVLFENAAHYGDPAPLARDGGGFRVWFTRQDLDTGEAQIWAAELPALTELPDVAPAPSLTATEEWEEDFVGEPAIVDLGDGALVLYYRGGRTAPAVGRADSSDGGATFTKHPDNPLVPLATDPTVALLAQGAVLYYTSPDPAEPGILAADSSDGVEFEPRSQPVIEPRPDLEEAFDADAVGDPFALVTLPLDDADPVHVGLFFTGTRPGDTPDETRTSIGYAGSYDGASFERFLDADPVLDGGQPSEAGPAALVVPAGGVLFFHETKQNRDRVGAAVHP